MRSNRIVALVAVAGVAFSLVARADGGRVAVKRFKAEGVEPSTASALESKFCSAMGDQQVDVLCPEELEGLLQLKAAQMNFGACSDDDQKCTEQIAKLAQAARIVTGKISKVGSVYLVDLTLLDANTSKVVARASDQAQKPEDLIGKMDELAKKLAAKAK